MHSAARVAENGCSYKVVVFVTDGKNTLEDISADIKMNIK
jgi:hypothetical protein